MQVRNALWYILIGLFLFPNAISLVYGQTKLESNDAVSNEQFLKQLGVQLGVVLIPLFIGIFTTRYLVNSWQRNKDISQIRQSVMENFQQSVKNVIVFTDIFVARVVFGCSTFEKKQGTKIYPLKDLAPFGFAFPSVKDSFPGNKIKSEVFVDFPPKDIFLTEVKEYQNKIYEYRLMLSKFLSGLRQYYVSAQLLNKQFDELWMYVNMTNVLALKIARANDMEEFTSLVKLYNKAAAILFRTMVRFDAKLSIEEITLTKEKKDFEYVEKHFEYVLKAEDFSFDTL